MVWRREHGVLAGKRVAAALEAVGCAIFERSGLRKSCTEKLKPRQLDARCDQSNVTAV